MTEIRKAGERATRLTQQLLSFARREVVRPKVLDLTGVVLEMEQLLRRTLGEHVVLRTSLAPDLWPIMADYGQLEQVLVNLAVNARDAMPDGGTLTLDTENIAVDDAYAQHPHRPVPGRYVRLRVSDTGVGMSREVAARAFEPFFTTKPKGQGTGLGLATIHGIVTQAGGHVQIYSEPGLGTTFTVLLPATDAPVPGRTPARSPASRERGGGETILVVEDEPAMLEVTRRILDGNGYEVLTARRGPRGARARRAPPRRDRRPADRRRDAGDARQGGRRARQRAAARHPRAVHVRLRAARDRLDGRPRRRPRDHRQAVHRGRAARRACARCSLVAHLLDDLVGHRVLLRGRAR